MNVALAAVALVVGVGTVVAISVRDLRAGLIGLTVALVGGTLLVDPLPAPAVLGVRMVGALLAVAVLRATLLEEPDGTGAGSSFGWPAEAIIGGAAAVGGAGIALSIGQAGGLTGVTPGVLITATATGLLALGAGPAILGRSGARRAIGLVVIAQAVILLRTGLAGTPAVLEQVVLAGLLLGCAVAGAVLDRDAVATPDPADEPA